MKSITKKMLKRSLLAVCLIVLFAVGYFGNMAYRMAGVGAAYKAKILSSGVFVSGREAQSILAEDLAPTNELEDMFNRYAYTNIDQSAKTVSCTAFGFIGRRAIYREGLGCTLLLDVSEDDLRAQTGPLPTPFPANPEKVPWPTGDLVTDDTLPSEVDEQALNDALSNPFFELDPSLPLRTRAVIVVYKGRIIAERYAPGVLKDTPLIGWSMTKSVTNALVGILVGQGKLTLSAPAPVPEWSEPGDPRGAITLNQLMRMSSGLEFGEVYTDPLSDACRMLLNVPDAAMFSARNPLQAEPGSKWHYSSGTTNIISRIIRDTFGGDQTEYFSFPRKALFNRIGMRSAVIEPDPSGTFIGSSFMYATARDWARFGLLYLQDGVWEGERILPEGWIEYTTTPAPNAPQGKYGAQFWLNAGENEAGRNRSYPNLPPDLFYASGFEGQSVCVIPSRELVTVRLGMTKAPARWGISPFLANVLKSIRERT